MARDSDGMAVRRNQMFVNRRSEASGSGLLVLRTASAMKTMKPTRTKKRVANQNSDLEELPLKSIYLFQYCFTA